MARWSHPIAPQLGVSSDLDLNDVVDIDEETCSNEELLRSFNNPYLCTARLVVVYKHNYILHLDGNGIENAGYIAAGLTDKTVLVYNSDNLAFLHKLQFQSLDLIGLKFSLSNPNLLFVGTKDKVALWDLRAKPDLPTRVFYDHTIGDNPKRLKPLTAFDVSLDDQVLCGGTEQRGENTFLLFWDIRQSQLEGGYWDSHGGDITQVKFHPRERDSLAVSSIEGLLNIFDVGEGSEDEALMMSMNTEDISVDKMAWYDTSCSKKSLCCLTHCESIQMWDVTEPVPMRQHLRQEITDVMKRRLLTNTYLVNCHPDPDNDSIYVVCGSAGRSSGCLRVLLLDETLHPYTNLVADRSQQIVRCSYFLPKSRVFITGGESGVLNMWRPYTEGMVPADVGSGDHAPVYTTNVTDNNNYGSVPATGLCTDDFYVHFDPHAPKQWKTAVYLSNDDDPAGPSFSYKLKTESGPKQELQNNRSRPY